ncbi:MAG TPA: hypothetical protein VIA06_12790 [Candidatus Dormibacteraeota bacterium]|jgi:ParB-like chromosome segregation protein Spo0J|nr:hypothetical protein [Candidatus Dormibacteraeota bacterium]
MQQTTQPANDEAADLEEELAELRLYPAEPLQPSERLLEEGELPFELTGPEPEAAMLRLLERFGFPQRLLVAPAEEEGDGDYRILEESRWLRAAREAGIDRIPVRVLPARGLSAALLILILNQPRAAAVAAQADALEQLLAAGISEGAIARAAGMTKAKVARLGKLLELDPNLRRALREDGIKAPVAFAAAALPGEVQALLAADYERDGALTSAQVREVRDRIALEEAAAEREAAGEAMVEDEVQPEPESAPVPDVATDRVRRQAKALLQQLEQTDLPEELAARLAGVLEDIGQVKGED